MANEEAIAALNKTATALKREGDMKGAIAALRRAKALAGNGYEDTRLAKYLQDAGRFDEAMAEIQWLLERCAQQCRVSFGHQPEVTIQCQEASHRARIHAAAALICKKAKATELQSYHETEATKLTKEHQRLHPLSRQAQKDRLDTWEDAKRGGAQGITAYLQGKKV